MYNSIQEFNRLFPFKNYIADVYGIKYWEGKKSFNIPCPFHVESTASCAIYDNSYYCFGAGCGAHGHSYDFLISQGLMTEDILRLDEKYSSVEISVSREKRRNNKIPGFLVKIYNEDLLNNEEKMEYVINRHFDRWSIEKSKIGYVENIEGIFGNFEAPRYIIPVYDYQQNLRTARYRIDPYYEHKEEYRSEPKYLGHPGCNSYLYNSHIISDNNNIVIVGSEFDAAFMYYRYGICAIAPPGEGNFRKEWFSYFTRHHNVLIWLDYDYAGISAALNLYQSIKSVCKAKIYNWDNSFKNKQDVCDFVDRFGIEGVYEELDKYGVKAYN